MPLYEYKCGVCEHITSDFRGVEDRDNPVVCEICGCVAKKIISLPNADLPDNERWSWSMGVNPKQVSEAMNVYPGSEYNKKGQLKIKNRTHKLREMKRRGLVEQE